MKFVDEIKLIVASGHGGPGAVSFRREAMTPRGGPDGGDGGRGGHVVVRGRNDLNTLVHFQFRKEFRAADGTPGKSRNMTGPDGSDLFLDVPVGTLVRDAASGDLLFDVTLPGEFVLLKGGRGGKGNWFFRTSVNQAPEKSQPGEPGEELQIHLELKLIADVGIIGFPNAGKSTLISVISAARPKIADYPFTTLVPQLGVVRLNDDVSCVVADIPGLVPGAHKGVGLGTQFLRHVERTAVFVHLLDGGGHLVERDPIEDFDAINSELAMYQPHLWKDEDAVSLTAREQIVVINKCDLLSSDQRHELLDRFGRRGIRPLFISAATSEGIKELLNTLLEMKGRTSQES